MTYIFNKSSSPSFFGHLHFRIAYTLLPAIRALTLKSIKNNQLKVMSIACGTALELSCFELLSRSQGINVNYIGCDINKKDMLFNYHVLRKKSSNVNQKYQHRDIAASPPNKSISTSDCIIWRHPEFLSDHKEIPNTLIIKMAQIMWNILRYKSDHSPILITCYDPHEMLLVIELLKQFCDSNIELTLKIDKQDGRASINNPMVSSEDVDPLFNPNNHDQFQLTIEKCKLSDKKASSSLFLTCLANSFKTIISKISTKNEQPDILDKLNNPDFVTLRNATTFLNDKIRNAINPFEKRDEFIELLTLEARPRAGII